VSAISDAVTKVDPIAANGLIAVAHAIKDSFDDIEETISNVVAATDKEH